jgi:hypothetical protein
MLVTDPARIEAVLSLLVAGNTAQFVDPAIMRELGSWLRFSRAPALRTGDGPFSGASGNPVPPDRIGRAAFGLAFRAGAENAKLTEAIRFPAGLAAIVTEADDRAHWVTAGQAAQRFALRATTLGLAHA